MLQRHLEQLPLLWELVLLNQPLVVVSPTPDLCSKVVLSLCSLIAPVRHFVVLLLLLLLLLLLHVLVLPFPLCRHSHCDVFLVTILWRYPSVFYRT